MSNPNNPALCNKDLVSEELIPTNELLANFHSYVQAATSQYTRKAYRHVQY